MNWFSVFVITENSVKQSLFGVFSRKEIKLSEAPEIWCHEVRNYAMIPTRESRHVWLFFSTERAGLAGRSPKKMRNQKNTIGIYLTKNRYDKIKAFVGKDIANLPPWFLDAGK